MKELTIKNQVQKINEKDIISFGSNLEIDIPLYFVSFISKYGGARVLENSFQENYFIQNILPLSSSINASIESVLDTYIVEYETKNWLPFAIDSGGWVFVLSLHKDSYGQVFVDKFDSGDEDSFVFVCETFNEFINNLKVSS